MDRVIVPQRVPQSHQIQRCQDRANRSEEPKTPLPRGRRSSHGGAAALTGAPQRRNPLCQQLNRRTRNPPHLTLGRTTPKGGTSDVNSKGLWFAEVLRRLDIGRKAKAHQDEVLKMNDPKDEMSLRMGRSCQVVHLVMQHKDLGCQALPPSVVTLISNLQQQLKWSCRLQRRRYMAEREIARLRTYPQVKQITETRHPSCSTAPSVAGSIPGRRLRGRRRRKGRSMKTRRFTALSASLAAGLVAVGVLAGPTPAHAAATRPAPAQQTFLAEGPGWSIYTESPTIPTATAVHIARPDGVKPLTVINCGWVTCSEYLSRAQTGQLNTNIILAGGGFGGLAVSCGLFTLMSGPAAVIVAVACGVSITIYGAFMLNAVARAAGNHGCLRVRYGGGAALFFYDDHSSYCRDT